jgi:hypothetical protein
MECKMNLKHTVEARFSYFSPGMLIQSHGLPRLQQDLQPAAKGMELWLQCSEILQIGCRI